MGQRPHPVLLPRAKQIVSVRDALGRRTSLTRPNGINTAYAYDGLSHLLSVLHKNGSTVLDGATYTYDNAGNRLAKLNSLNSVTEGYTYDPLYQLTQVVQGDGWPRLLISLAQSRKRVAGGPGF